MRRWLPWWWLALAGLCGAWVLSAFLRGGVLETDLLRLLPATEQNSHAEQAVNALYGQLGNRILLLAGAKDAAQAHAAAHQLASVLRHSPAFRRVVLEVPTFNAQQLLDTYLPYAPGLLTAIDRQQLQQATPDVQHQLLRRLGAPFQDGIPTPPSLDPFGYLQRWLGQLPLAQTRLQQEQGVLVARQSGQTYVLLVLEPQGAAFDAATQRAVITGLQQAEREVKAQHPGVQLLRTGALFYASSAREQASHEVDLIGGGSLLGVLLLLWLLFRSIKPLLLGMLTVGIGMVFSCAAVLLVYGKIHLITLVFGVSLIGEAIDYAIQYFAAHLEAGSRWEARQGMRRVLPGLLVALCTSLLGYGALTLTPFPAISQIALFAFAGLVAAWLSVALLLPRWVQKPGQHDGLRRVRWPAAVLHWWLARMTLGRGVLLVGALLLACLPGWLRLQGNDDIHLLVSHPAQLVAEERQVRQLVGISEASRFFLTEGADAEQALQREAVLVSRLREHLGQGVSGFTAVSDLVPPVAQQRGDQALLRQRLPASAVLPVMQALGFPDEAMNRWQSRSTWPVLTLDHWMQQPLAGVYRHQVMPLPGGQKGLILILQGDDGRLDLDAVARGLPGVTVVNKARSVSRMFQQYRQLGYYWLPGAMGMVLLVLLVRYRLRNACAIMLPNLVALAVSLSAYGLTGQPFTLFSLMGLMLVLGVGVNYAIFLLEAGVRNPVPFAGVLLSAATTVLSFGLLSLSSMPALNQFGTVLLFGIICSVLLAPLSLTFGRARCAGA
ncbi:MMPL family transporter [Leeia aquatica]|uniref:MMPL family transporter n=1 Tax=Leeia aquatica TaxID=2725557 RepID=A0A847SB08_9NEIS|nr:MMPL family transporter [Leeia aquatica]NLR76097.1 MMPL family transporter [Leeia aquatica]